MLQIKLSDPASRVCPDKTKINLPLLCKVWVKFAICEFVKDFYHFDLVGQLIQNNFLQRKREIANQPITWSQLDALREADEHQNGGEKWM